MGPRELDVSERTFAAAAGAVLAHTADLVAVFALDEAAGYPVLHVNDAVVTSTGLSRDDIVGRPLGELQADWAVEHLVARAREATRAGRPIDFQAVREVPAGRVTYQVTVCPLPELGDDPPHVVALGRDVTSLRRVAEALSETQELAHVGHWVWDVAADEVRWSQELYRIYGLDRDEFEASYEGFLERVHLDDRERVDDIIRQAFETGGRFEFDHRIVRPDGDVRTLAARGRVTLDRHDEPIRMAGTGQDVTELRRAEELERGLERARRGQRQAAELTEGVVQQLTTALLAFEAEEHEQGVRVVRTTLEHTRDLVDDLLTRAGTNLRLGSGEQRAEVLRATDGGSRPA